MIPDEAAQKGSRKWGIQRTNEMRITVEQWRTKMDEMSVHDHGSAASWPACPPRTEGDKPHCPDCSGIVGETGVVW